MAEITLLAGDVDMSGICVPGYEPKEGERMSVRENFVGPGYFSTMGIPLVAAAKSHGKMVLKHQGGRGQSNRSSGNTSVPRIPSAED